MPTSLHFPVTHNNIIRHLANCNSNHKFSVCPYSILQEFVVDNEVIVMSHHEIVRELHIWRQGSDRVLKRIAFLALQVGYPMGSWYQLDLQWRRSDLSSCMFLARATVSCSWAVTEARPTSTTLAPTWCTSVGSSTTTLAWLRCLMRGDNSVWPGHACYLLLLHSPKMNAFKSGKI